MRHRPILFAILFAVYSLGCAIHLPMQGTRSGVLVHARFESSEPGTILHQQVGTNLVEGRPNVREVPTYTPICEAPCEVDLDVGPPLYVGGQNIRRSDLFKLEDARGPVSIEAHAGSFTQLSLGTAYVIAGSFCVFGFGGMSLGEAFDRSHSGTIPVGLSGLGIGIVAITLGAVLINTSKTRVKLWSAPTLAPPARSNSPPEGAFASPR